MVKGNNFILFDLGFELKKPPVLWGLFYVFSYLDTNRNNSRRKNMLEALIQLV